MTLEDLIPLTPLTDDEVVRLNREQEAQREAEKIRVRKEAEDIVLGVEAAPETPEAAIFDFARDFASLRAPDPLIPGLIETGPWLR